jgi:hypothetical protein
MRTEDSIAATVDAELTKMAVHTAVAETLTAIATPPLASPTVFFDPSPTPVRTPDMTLTPTSVGSPTVSPTPQPVPPVLVKPEQGKSYMNPVAFEWYGLRDAGQRFQVTAQHTESGFVLQSGFLTGLSWSSDLPAEKHGEWWWKVDLVHDGSILSSSDRRMFWFTPYPVDPTSTLVMPTAEPSPSPYVYP